MDINMEVNWWDFSFSPTKKIKKLICIWQAHTFMRYSHIILTKKPLSTLLPTNASSFSKLSFVFAKTTPHTTKIRFEEKKKKTFYDRNISKKCQIVKIYIRFLTRYILDFFFSFILILFSEITPIIAYIFP